MRTFIAFILLAIEVQYDFIQLEPIMGGWIMLITLPIGFGFVMLVAQDMLEITRKYHA